MQDIEYFARPAFDENMLPNYLTPKDHLLILQGQVQKNIRRTNKAELTKVLVGFEQMNLQGKLLSKIDSFSQVLTHKKQLKIKAFAGLADMNEDNNRPPWAEWKEVRN